MKSKRFKKRDDIAVDWDKAIELREVDEDD
jgi:hypothetical protein